MYLWAARSQARRGMGGEAAAFMAETRDLVSSITGMTFWTWAGAAGCPLGTMFMSARVESMEQYMAANMAVNGNADYQALTKKGADLLDGPTETVFGQVIGMGGEMAPEPAPLVVTTTATTAPGRQGAAVAWGAELNSYMAELTGTTNLFAMGHVGAISDVSWVQSHDDAASIDRVIATVMSDEGYQERMSKAGDLFVPGSAQRIVMARM